MKKNVCCEVVAGRPLADVVRVRCNRVDRPALVYGYPVGSYPVYSKPLQFFNGVGSAAHLMTFESISQTVMDEWFLKTQSSSGSDA